MSDKDQKTVKLAGIIAGALVLLSVVVMLVVKQFGATPGTATGAPGTASASPAGYHKTPQEQALEAEDKTAGTPAAAPAAGR